MSEHKCCHPVSTNRFTPPFSQPCGNRAKVEHEGKWYCGIHDPIKAAAKKAERDAKWRAERNAPEPTAIRRSLESAALAGLSDAQLTAIIEAGGVSKLVELAQDLYDNQNGCPLPSYEEDWTAAYNGLGGLLTKLEAAGD